MQIVIVYIIILLAAGMAVRYLWRKLSRLKKNDERDGCVECPLKNSCRKANPGKEEYCGQKKSPET